ncbi:MAG: HEAT repeat domain-containing protein [Anaerolineales bacterium]|nr:HEAT repeat domain-containing protein [Anaerolineales bacterium]
MTTLADLFSGDDDRAQAALAQVTADDLPALVEALSSTKPATRSWAAAALGTLPSPEAVSALVAASADPDVEVRAAVLHALGRQRAPEAVTPLLFALSDPSPYLARVAADSLIQIGAPAVPALCEALDREVESRVRVQLARALALIGDTRAIPALFRALEDESHLVAHWAEEGLERMGVGQVYFRL